MRQAIRYAIDYEGLVELNRGTVSILQTTAWTGGQGYNPELAYYYKQDLEKAKALMVEAAMPTAWRWISGATRKASRASARR